MSRRRDANSTRSKIMAFFAEHDGKTFTARQIAEKFGIHPKHAASELFHLFQKGVLARRSHGGKFLYRATGAKMPESTQAASTGGFTLYQLGVLAFLQRNAGQDFSATEIAEELCRDRKYISGTLLSMYHCGLVIRVSGTYPYRYTIADDERIPALLAELDEKPVNQPLSPFWQGMAVWDSAVKAVVNRF